MFGCCSIGFVIHIIGLNMPIIGLMPIIGFVMPIMGVHRIHATHVRHLLALARKSTRLLGFGGCIVLI